jgi:hypothetical protein
MVLNQLTRQLGWPNTNEIFHPAGPGAKVLVHLAQTKLARSIEQTTGVTGIRVGILASNPDTSEAPLAIVCAFPTSVQQTTLLEAQRLAWNFSRSLLLITIEPHIIRTWSCCEPPVQDDEIENTPEISSNERQSPELSTSIQLDPVSGQVLEQQASEALSWVDLVSGDFFKSHPGRFKRERRADTMLLSNLKEVRRSLQSIGLESRYIHDLLARIIFVQFLFDRKDSNNQAALNGQKLRELYDLGILSAVYTSLADILGSYNDTYALFGWLNQRFNGDLFPGTGGTTQKQPSAWEEEKRYVQPQHSENPHVIYQRCIRTYEAKQVQGAPVLLVHLVKPDQMRYWTRSMALRDGDEIAADLMVWGASSTA